MGLVGLVGPAHPKATITTSLYLTRWISGCTLPPVPPLPPARDETIGFFEKCEGVSHTPALHSRRNSATTQARHVGVCAERLGRACFWPVHVAYWRHAARPVRASGRPRCHPPSTHPCPTRARGLPEQGRWRVTVDARAPGRPAEGSKGRRGRPLAIPSPWRELALAVGGLKALADRLGVTTKTVRRWSRGSAPTLAHWKAMWEVCDEVGVERPEI